MLDIILSATDTEPVVKLSFEHSLVSISKWESLHNKPFFGLQEKTREESDSYVKCMLTTSDAPLNFLKRFGNEQYFAVSEYIDSPQSGTTFGIEPENKGVKEVVTSELIYYWLVQFNIPFQPTETWHLNRLMTLVKIAGIRQSKPKKMSKSQLAEKYRAMNEQRRRELGTSG